MDLHSRELEQSALSVIFKNPDTFHEMALSLEDFHSNDHKVIYKSITELVTAEIPVDVVTISEDLEKKGLLSLAGGMKYVGELLIASCTPRNASTYAKVLVEKKLARMAISELSSALAKIQAGDSPGECLMAMNDSIDSAMASGNEGVDFRQVIDQGFDMIERAMELRAKGSSLGIKTGLDAIDDRTGGLLPSQFWLIAARPGLGKTAMCLQWLIRMASDGVPVGNISLEMNEAQLATRAMANFYQVNGSALRYGDNKTVGDLLDRVHAKGEKEKFASLPIYTDCDTFDFPSIESRIVQWVRKYGVKVVVLDHVGLIELSGYNTANERLGFISRRLKILAKKLSITIVALSQLNRSNEKENRPPRNSDLRDSGSLEQDANVILFIHSEDQTDSKLKPVSLILGKNRDGIQGAIPDEFIFNGPTQTFMPGQNKCLP